MKCKKERRNNMNMSEKWVCAWGNAISIAERRPENYAKDLTLRYPVSIPFAGKKIRLHFDNFCGSEDVILNRVCVAAAAGGDNILPETERPVTFGGRPDVILHAGEDLYSDEVDFEVFAGQDVSVSFYLKGFTEMRSGVVITGPLSRGFFAVGDCTSDKELPYAASKVTNTYYFLSGIDVLTDSRNKALICFGDSITAQAWPDYLLIRTAALGYTHRSVIRRAASGTRILRQYDNITYDSYGLKGSIRFPREIKVSGADCVLIQHGINDIIHPVGVMENKFRPWSDLPTADDLIGGMREYIKTARQQNLKVYAGTLLPIYGWRTYADFRDEIRCAFNDWIRTTDEIDGCIDFDKALRDPENPAAFAPGYDSGDHLHPSAKAYERMAEEVPEGLLK